MFNFLALLDIRVFGRLYLWLLIGLALFLQPGCFCLALNLQIPLELCTLREIAYKIPITMSTNPTNKMTFTISLDITLGCHGTLMLCLGKETITGTLVRTASST